MKIRKRTRFELGGGVLFCGALVFLAATAIGSSAQTFTNLLDFDGTGGTNPISSLVQGPDGNFYGTTPTGGVSSNCPLNSCGTIFRITPEGELTTLHNFCAQAGCSDGYEPLAALILGSDGNFYGATPFGSNPSCNSGSGCGTLFKITPVGKFTTLHSFNGSDGSGPGPLVQGSPGVFYGLTASGGANHLGTFFRITAAGALTTLLNFDTVGPGGAGVLTLATNGNFYGATPEGGTSSCGSAFEITPVGALTTLVDFDSTNGCRPASGVIQAADGNFYGTTFAGGSRNKGTVFKMTPTGSPSVLYSFCPLNTCADGKEPNGLVRATDGNLYGTAESGAIDCPKSGNGGCGTVFEITTGGTLTTLYRFHGTDGAFPSAALVQATNGTFYGATWSGGSISNYGTVFSLAVGLGPFVETNPAFGKVGARVAILGSNLTGTSGVSFNGQEATFRILSATTIIATVPVGATTGNVEVTTPTGKLTSNVPFVVRP